MIDQGFAWLTVPGYSHYGMSQWQELDTAEQREWMCACLCSAPSALPPTYQYLLPRKWCRPQWAFHTNWHNQDRLPQAPVVQTAPGWYSLPMILNCVQLTKLTIVVPKIMMAAELRVPSQSWADCYRGLWGWRQGIAFCSFLWPSWFSVLCGVPVTPLMSPAIFLLISINIY